MVDGGRALRARCVFPSGPGALFFTACRARFTSSTSKGAVRGSAGFKFSSLIMLSCEMLLCSKVICCSMLCICCCMLGIGVIGCGVKIRSQWSLNASATWFGSFTLMLFIFKYSNSSLLVPCNLCIFLQKVAGDVHLKVSVFFMILCQWWLWSVWRLLIMCRFSIFKSHYIVWNLSLFSLNLFW